MLSVYALPSAGSSKIVSSTSPSDDELPDMAQPLDVTVNLNMITCVSSTMSLFMMSTIKH